MTDPVDGFIRWAQGREYRQRTVVPGLVVLPTDGLRERQADFQTGVADLVAGMPSAPDITPDAPVLSIVGGGFYVLLPTLPGDEMLGLVSDRALTDWIPTRTPGLADPIHGKRTKALHDIVLTPFAITAPEGAPTTWDHLILGGPLGAAIDVELTGAVTITKAGAPIATIEMDVAGAITITPAPGQSVNVGGPGAVALTKAQSLEAALIAAANAVVATPDVKAGFTSLAGLLIGLASTTGTTTAKGI